MHPLGSAGESFMAGEKNLQPNGWSAGGILMARRIRADAMRSANFSGESDRKPLRMHSAFVSSLVDRFVIYKHSHANSSIYFPRCGLLCGRAMCLPHNEHS
jgi:hypothetical protein